MTPLDDTPPPIHKDEQDLSRNTRTTLAQLRTGYSKTLQSYHHRLDPTTPDTCPLCNQPGHTTTHLFNCPKRPTNLTPTNLWTQPVKNCTIPRTDKLISPYHTLTPHTHTHPHITHTHPHITHTHTSRTHHTRTHAHITPTHHTSHAHITSHTHTHTHITHTHHTHTSHAHITRTHHTHITHTSHTQTHHTDNEDNEDYINQAPKTGEGEREKKEHLIAGQGPGGQTSP